MVLHFPGWQCEWLAEIVLPTFTVETWCWHKETCTNISPEVNAYKRILIKGKKYNTQEEEQRIAQVLTCSEVSKAVLSTGTSGAEGKQKLLLQGLWKEEKVILGHSDLISTVHKHASPIWKSSCNNALLSYAQCYSSMSSSKLWGFLHNSEPSDWNKTKALKGMQCPIPKP